MLGGGGKVSMLPQLHYYRLLIHHNMYITFLTLLFCLHNVVDILHVNKIVLIKTNTILQVCIACFADGRLGFEDVVQYLLETHKVSVDLRDTGNKTMIFHAVTSSQPSVLRYLLSQVSYALK